MIDALPDALLAHVLADPDAGAFAASGVCRRWRAVCRDGAHWRSAFRAEFGVDIVENARGFSLLPEQPVDWLRTLRASRALRSSNAATRFNDGAIHRRVHRSNEEAPFCLRITDVDDVGVSCCACIIAALFKRAPPAATFVYWHVAACPLCRIHLVAACVARFMCMKPGAEIEFVVATTKPCGPPSTMNPRWSVLNFMPPECASRFEPARSDGHRRNWQTGHLTSTLIDEDRIALRNGAVVRVLDYDAWLAAAAAAAAPPPHSRPRTVQVLLDCATDPDEDFDLLCRWNDRRRGRLVHIGQGPATRTVDFSPF
jgi:hypothetical protein